jgi:hypothetical protein
MPACLPDALQSSTTFKVVVRTASGATSAWDGEVYLTLHSYASSSKEVSLLAGIGGVALT